MLVMAGVLVLMWGVVSGTFPSGGGGVAMGVGG